MEELNINTPEEQAVENPNPANTEVAITPTNTEEVVASTPAPERTPAVASPPKVITRNTTPLYVTIDGLNMRSAPHLDSAVIVKLQLHEAVEFMNEVTDSTQAINLGKAIANEPWIKVRHKKGHTGWVYGAGVHYYKMKNPDAE